MAIERVRHAVGRFPVFVEHLKQHPVGRGILPDKALLVDIPVHTYAQALLALDNLYASAIACPIG